MNAIVLLKGPLQDSGKTEEHVVPHNIHIALGAVVQGSGQGYNGVTYYLKAALLFLLFVSIIRPLVGRVLHTQLTTRQHMRQFPYTFRFTYCMGISSDCFNQ